MRDYVGLIQISTDAVTWDTHDEGVVAVPYSLFFSDILNEFVMNTNSGFYVSGSSPTISPNGKRRDRLGNLLVTMKSHL